MHFLTATIALTLFFTTPVYHREAIRLLGIGIASWAAATQSGTSSSTSVHAEAAIANKNEPAGQSKALCDDAVSHLRNSATQSDIWLVGTAHISDSSAQVITTFAILVEPSALSGY